MSLATDPRYRSVTLQWQNNSETGTELVEVFARPSGGAWGLARTLAVGVTEQSATWDTAAPLTHYDLAMRYSNKSTPAVGYESNDPDLWTAPTAAGSKSSVTTSSESVAWGTPNISPTIATLKWTSAQQNAPYLLEKSLDGGMTYTTVIANLVASSYAYAIPGGELNTTVKFRLTAQRDATVGPTAGTLDVFLGLAVGVPDLVSLSATMAPGNMFPISLFAYVSWSRTLTGATATFAKLRHRDAAGGGHPPGAWIEDATVAFSAVAIQDVPAQPDGFSPVGIVTGSVTTPAASSANDVQVALGISDGIGGVSWGAWVDAAVQLEQISRMENQPVPTLGALTSTDAHVTLTVPAQTPTLVIFDVGSGWSMLKASTFVGVNALTLKIPSVWRGSGLYVQDFVNEEDAGPLVLAQRPVAPTRTLIGVIP